ncbi:hypothetical protein GQ53DRAFT_877929 [Thozetella sp. PMI_491]|nr:hypothetical protein GQ53DRAFT_877929 [Thozetella sp. PMI_491]
MDPITAVSLASNVVAFIDFSWSLVRGTYEVHTSKTGTTVENAHISTVVDDLREATRDLDIKFCGSDKDEKAIAQLSKECVVLSEDLGKILARLKAKDDSKWASLRIKWQSMRKSKEIASIEQRLAAYRSEIGLRLNLLLTGQQNIVRQHLDKLEKEAKKLSAESAKNLAEIRGKLKLEALRSSSVNTTWPTSRSEDAVRARTVTPWDDALEGSIAESGGFVRLRHLLTELETRARNIPKENYILGRLFYDSMYQREDSVEDAHEGTFNWIVQGAGDLRPTVVTGLRQGNDTTANDPSLSEATVGVRDASISMPLSSSSAEDLTCRPSSEEHLGVPSPYYANDLLREQQRRHIVSNNFLSFLRGDNGVYFICGKAGSGKSTLMKFLGQDVTVRDALEDWAGSKMLVAGHFYFWKSGDKLQMSLEGLYRSLLFTALSKCPSLLPEIFPDDWEIGSVPHLTNRPFRPRELQKAVENLMAMKNSFGYRFYFFIDGLDEYKGDSVEYFRLARQLRQWAANADVKVICSARPYTEFLNTLNGEHHILQLHELTRSDIRRFATVELERSSSYDVQTGFEYESIVEEIIRNADGIFLWARLVVRSVLDGIAHGDSCQSLQDRIDNSPRDLNRLFAQMLQSVDPATRSQSTRMLLLALDNPHSQPLSALAFSWIEDVDHGTFPLDLPIRSYSDGELSQRRDRVARQLAAYTGGLLEVDDARYSQPSVQFLHRTVRDYFESDTGRAKLRKDRKAFKIPSAEVYFRLQLAELKCGLDAEDSFSGLYDLMSAPGYNSYSFPSHYLDELEAVHRRMSEIYLQRHGHRSTNVSDVSGHFLDGRLPYVVARLERLGSNFGTEEALRLFIASWENPHCSGNVLARLKDRSLVEEWIQDGQLLCYLQILGHFYRHGADLSATIILRNEDWTKPPYQNHTCRGDMEISRSIFGAPPHALQY